MSNKEDVACLALFWRAMLGDVARMGSARAQLTVAANGGERKLAKMSA